MPDAHQDGLVSVSLISFQFSYNAKPTSKHMISRYTSIHQHLLPSAQESSSIQTQAESYSFQYA